MNPSKRYREISQGPATAEGCVERTLRQAPCLYEPMGPYQFLLALRVGPAITPLRVGLCDLGILALESCAEMEFLS